MSNTRHSRTRRRLGFFAKSTRPVVDLRYLEAGARRLPPNGSQRGGVGGDGELPGLIAPDERPGCPGAR
jgi:hypothetical protein